MLIEAKFHVESPWDKGTKFCSNDQGHMTIWPPCPYMIKTLKLLVWNQKCDDFETGMQHQVLEYHQSKTISNDQELIQSDPKSCPQNQKGNN